MSIVHRCCAALDIHKESVTVCVRTGVSRREQTVETAKFGTFTEDLEQLAEWLKQRKVRHVAMESTGVYWKPVWNVLELTPAFPSAVGKSGAGQSAAGQEDGPAGCQAHLRVPATGIAARQLGAGPATAGMA